MTITNIVGASSDERSAIKALLEDWHHAGAGPMPSDLVDRLPVGRVDVHVRSKGGANAVMVFENGVISLHCAGAVRVIGTFQPSVQ